MPLLLPCVFCQGVVHHWWRSLIDVLSGMDHRVVTSVKKVDRWTVKVGYDSVVVRWLLLSIWMKVECVLLMLALFHY